MNPTSRFSRAEGQDRGFPFFRSLGVPEKSLFLLPYEEGRGSSDLPLSPVEQEQIEAVARYMDEEDYLPALVLASRTERGRKAVTILTSMLGRAPAAFMERGLRLGSVQDVFERLRCVSNFIPSVLLVADRPTLEGLAHHLSSDIGQGEEHAARQHRLRNLPGGIFVALSLAIDSWGAMAPKSGLLEAYIRPADLMAQNA